jgi:hypothetical protein
MLSLSQSSYNYKASQTGAFSSTTLIRDKMYNFQRNTTLAFKRNSAL